MEKEELEIWKDIVGFEGFYQCSNLGRIKSFKFGKERILKPRKDKDAYCIVGLWKEGKVKTCRVHRLVSQAFLPNPNNLPCVNHKDENPSNNCIENLEFCDVAYNNSYGTRLERIGKAVSIANKGKKQSQETKEKRAKARQKPILQLSKSGNIILGKFNSAKQAGNELNINKGQITQCCRGKVNSAKGYKWMYYDDYVNKMNNYFNLALKEVS